MCRGWTFKYFFLFYVFCVFFNKYYFFISLKYYRPSPGMGGGGRGGSRGVGGAFNFFRKNPNFDHNIPPAPPSFLQILDPPLFKILNHPWQYILMWPEPPLFLKSGDGPVSGVESREWYLIDLLGAVQQLRHVFWTIFNQLRSIYTQPPAGGLRSCWTPHLSAGLVITKCDGLAVDDVLASKNISQMYRLKKFKSMSPCRAMPMATTRFSAVDMTVVRVVRGVHFQLNIYKCTCIILEVISHKFWTTWVNNINIYVCVCVWPGLAKWVVYGS